MKIVKEKEVKYVLTAEKRAIWQKIVGSKIPTNRDDLKTLGTKTGKQLH
jgi:hypothetical protein